MKSLFGKGPSNTDDSTPRYARRDLGHGALREEVFEVWGDLLDLSDHDPAAIVALGERAVHHMHGHLKSLLPLDDVSMALYSDPEDHTYLLLIEWSGKNLQGMRGELGARAFGRCLDLFGILVLPQKWGADPNPAVRMAKLTAAQRRDVTIFQSLLKYTLDQLGEAIDEQRIV